MNNWDKRHTPGLPARTRVRRTGRGGRSIRLAVEAEGFFDAAEAAGEVGPALSVEGDALGFV